jgi:lipoprotein-anchoring transpeptidase ErfK/SrfK
VNERYLLTSADGPFGVAALGISAHSDVLKNWVQGGPVALHGTDQPSLIGDAVSHGCVRLANAVMIRLFRLAPAGTPVLIRP